MQRIEDIPQFIGYEDRANNQYCLDIQNVRILRTAIEILGFFGLLFFNIVTLGAFTCVGCYLQEKKIEELKSKIKNPDREIKYKWIPPVFIKPGSSGNPIPCKYSDDIARKVMENKTEMPELIKASFSWAFDDIRTRKKEAVLNHGEQIYFTGKDDGKFPFKNNMDAVHHWMVYLLIKNAGIDFGCDGVTPVLSFNDKIKIGNSVACHVEKKNSDPHVFFLHHDSWSPDPKKIPAGIDPVSVKYILEEFSNNPMALSHLENLLLQALLPLNNAHLTAAEQYIEQKGEDNKKVKNAYILITEMGKTIGQNFSELLLDEWKNIANNPSEIPVKPKKAYGLKRKITNFSAIKNPEDTWVAKIKKKALNILKMIGLVAAGFCTLGFVPLYYLSIRKKEMNKIKTGQTNDSAQKIKIFPDYKYTKAKNDPEAVKGNQAELEKYLKTFAPDTNLSSLKTLDPLMKGAFIETFDELVRIGKEAPGDLVFNAGAKILEQRQVLTGWEYTYAENRKALYQLMAYKLIYNAVLKTDSEGESRLYFNDTLSVGNSSPCNIPISSSSVTFFRNSDDWTPKNDMTMRLGVEPVHVKWILEKLKNTHRGIEELEILLVSPLIPKDHISLKNIQYTLSELPEESKLLISAYELLSDLAVTIGKNYENEFYSLWEKKANDKIAEPLLKEEIGISPDSLKKEVDWTPSVILEVIDYPILELVKTQTLLAPVWHDIHKYRVNKNISSQGTLPKTHEKSLEILSAQYYWVHVEIKNSGCLFSAFSIYLFQAAEKYGDMEPDKIREALAVYLEKLCLLKSDHQISEADSDTLDLFRIEIEQSTLYKKFEADQNLRPVLKEKPAWTIQEYIHWLKTEKSPSKKQERHRYDMGELELLLFSKVFKIGIHVFTTGEDFRLDQGLMMPKKTYGPNTKEKMILLNHPGFSFFVLMPKLRPPESFQGEENIISALKHNSDFWKKNNGIEWGHSLIIPA